LWFIEFIRIVYKCIFDVGSMEVSETFGYVLEGMKWLGVGGGAYIATLVGLTSLSRIFSERINSQEDLERFAGEEAKKLRMTERFKARFHNSWEENARILEGGTYEINLGGFGARRSMVRHELYHIHKNHLLYNKRQTNGLLKKLNYLFRQEPQAIAYEVFRLRI
jgi:hypothetical protein